MAAVVARLRIPYVPCSAAQGEADAVIEAGLRLYEQQSSAKPVDPKGWLWKRGEVHRGWKKRWFVLGKASLQVSGDRFF